MSDVMPTFLKNVETEPINESTMSELEEMIVAYHRAQRQLEDAEQAMKVASAKFNEISMERIPMFLLTHGVKSLELADGRKVSIKEDISVSVSDEAAFRKWLHERDEMDIVKVNYALARTDSDKLSLLSDFLMDNEFDFEINEGIHGQTKKKYFKELLATMGRHELPEWVNIFDIRKTVIK